VEEIKTAENLLYYNLLTEFWRTRKKCASHLKNTEDTWREKVMLGFSPTYS